MPESELSEELAGRGLRATRQRIAVLGTLRSASNHPTAGEIHRILLASQPHLSLKTVYQALESLRSVGLADCVTEGGEPYRYEAKTSPHYHGRCRVCGTLFDLPARVDARIRGETPIPEGFEVERIHVTLVGRCPRCRDDF
jgi:Fur family peroxide stress response transcriptional regulator